jgi:hypothetical protein
MCACIYVMNFNLYVDTFIDNFHFLLLEITVEFAILVFLRIDISNYFHRRMMKQKEEL